MNNQYLFQNIVSTKLKLAIHFLVVYFILTANSILAQNYLWPTNASTYLTSSFCEFRPGHYHSAIDIKTWNREGYPIYAIDDGRIYKIRVSPFGYGKVIYIKLNDGNFAVYAHLQKFSDSLEKQIRHKQLKNQKYRLNWYPQNMKIKRGEILGYTGSTGIGTPHLHFEIRNSKEQPLNPLAFYKEVKDNIRPRLQKIAIIPLDENSVVNKSFLPQIYDLTYIKDGVYVIKKPISGRGKLGLAIKGYDQADGVHNKFAFYQTILELSGKEVFQITYDKMDFGTTGYINTEIYYPFRHRTKEVFHKLYVEPFNVLPFYKKYPPRSDIIDIVDEPISFSIIVKDFDGNQSKIVGEIQADLPNQIEIQQKFIKEDWAYLKFKLNSFNFLSFSTSMDLKDWQPVNYFEILERKSGNPGHILFTKIKLSDSSSNFLRIETKAIDDKDVLKTINIASNDSTIIPEFLLSDKKFIVETTYSGNHLKVFYNNQYEILPTVQDLANRSKVAIPIRLFQHPDFKYGFGNPDTTQWIEPVDMQLFFPDQITKAFFQDSTISIQTGYNSFFDTTLIHVKTTLVESLLVDIPYKNRVYEFYPEDIAFLKGVTISITVDSLFPSSKWGIYELNGDDNISYITDNYDSIKHEFSFKTNSLGKFIVARDTIPPVLEINSPVENYTYKSNPQIRFTAYDDFSGIGNEENIKITVDSLFVLPEWDPEEKRIFARIDDPLDSGQHELVITIEDAVGNVTEKKITFGIR